jgi:hypothetical protein
VLGILHRAIIDFVAQKPGSAVNLQVPYFASGYGAMGCYCGLRTKQNKIRWIAFAVLAAVAFYMFIAFIVSFNGCVAALDRNSYIDPGKLSSPFS